MKKIIFTPFGRMEAGRLSSNLKFESEQQDKKAGDGEYRGFKNSHSNNEYVFAPTKDHTGLLSHITDPDDELYINAHCKAGYDELSNSEEMKGKQISIKDLINQLKNHDLPATTRAKIKLWACEGALDVKDELVGAHKESFATRFSRAMNTEYPQCRIFAYTKSLMGRYVKGSDKLFHKGVERSSQRASDFRLEFNNGKVIPSREKTTPVIEQQ